MNIIYGVCSWGLGHATRSLPIIRKLISEGNNLTIISHGRSLELLKNEIGNGQEYVELKDYPMLISDNSRQFMAKSMIYWPKFVARLRVGWVEVGKIIKGGGGGKRDFAQLGGSDRDSLQQAVDFAVKKAKEIFRSDE